jgi:peptidoglycan hydrolase-like protein with peptidoglycan-binding domain
MSIATARRATISAAVGAGGTNQADDVRLVQDLLNRARGSRLAVDGVCGPQTRAAIVDYQRPFLARPDGRVDPDGQTLRRLASDAERAGATGRSPAQGAPAAPGGGPATGLRLEPLGSGRGWYSYATADRQYGTATMLRVLRDVAAALHRAGLEYGVGDVSFAQGGAMPPHKTHTGGRHADLRPIRSDGAHRPTSITDPTYSRESTRRLVEALRAQADVTVILFDDTEIAGVRRWPGHHNHLHIQVR